MMKTHKGLLTISMAVAACCAVAGPALAGPAIDNSPDRARTALDPGLKQIGTIAPRSANEIAGSNWTLGCETLDRDFADYQQYEEYIVPLGIKTIRLQGGWAKTEKVKGTYDFAWLTITEGPAKAVFSRLAARTTR